MCKTQRERFQSLVTATKNSKFVPHLTRLISDQLKDRFQDLVQENNVPIQHELRYNKYYLVINITPTFTF
jgi:2'-5' RNA ligase